MTNPTLTRRHFLHLSWMALVGTAATACRPRPVPSPTAEQVGGGTAPAATPAAEEQVELSGGDTEVWAWQKAVTGKVAGDCPALVVYANDASMEVSRDGDQFSALVPVAEGENRLVAACQRTGGEEQRSNMLTYTGRLYRRPTAVIQVTVEENGIVLDGTGSTPDEGDPSPIVEYAWSARAGNPAVVLVQGAASEGAQEFTGEVRAARIVLAPPSVDGEYYFSLRVADQAGRTDASTTYVVVADGQPHVPHWETENPAWVERAVIYGVIPRNFGNHGFQSITEKLDYLQDLGVNGLWLAPVNVSPPGDYGYAVVDYFNLNPKYGTQDDFRTMVQAAHARGIRVLMDFVPNHSSEKHPYFQDTLKYGTASPYWDLYDRDETGAPTHYFDWSHLPNLNYDNPEVQRWMIEAFSYWVREFDVDGFRVDAAWGIKERRPDFWPLWRRELKRIKPDLLLLAEASARDPYYFDNGFDAAYDWTDQLGHWAWERVFESYGNTLLTYNLNSALTNQRRGLHPDALIFRFLNNNDTGTRFITTYGPGMTRVATAMLLTLPGIPCIYTGDEVGEAFRPYFDPQPLTWEEQVEGLRDYHKKLIALRKQMRSLHARQWLLLEVEPHQQALGYVRYVEPSAEPVLVLLNFFDQPVEAEVRIPPEFQALAARSSLMDVLSDEQVAISGPEVLKIPVPALSARILV